MNRQIEPLSHREWIDLQRSYYCLFDLMEEYRDAHPDATEDDAFDAVCRMGMARVEAAERNADDHH